MTTEERIINMVSWVADVAPSKIHIHTSLKDDLQMDSIDVMSLIVQLERWFKVNLTTEEVESIETIYDVANCIQKYELTT